MEAVPVTREDMRAYIRARLVALAEEVKMVSQQKPTEAQLRQHALDRAVTDGMVGAIHSSLMMTSQSKVGELTEFADPATLAKAVTEVADVFVKYLRGPEQPKPWQVAAAFHEAYERLAPGYGYKTQDATAVPWDEVPQANKELMTAVAAEMIERFGFQKRSL
jgi:hypothetical protein